MGYLPVVGAISPGLVQAFALLVREPERWWSVAEVAQGAGISKATVYRRFGNLAAAKAIRVKRHDDFRHYRLEGGWERVPLAGELYRRAQQRDLMP